MQEWLSVKDFVIKFAIPESTLRGWIKQGKLTVTRQNINNRPTQLIYLDDKIKLAVNEYKKISGFTASYQDLTANNNDKLATNDDTVQDAEIISDSPGPTNFSLVSLESSTVEKMLQTLKEFSDERAKALEDNNKQTQNEYFELKADNKRLQEEIKNINELLTIEKLKAAQFEAEAKINEIKIQELETKLSLFNERTSLEKNNLMSLLTKKL